MLLLLMLPLRRLGGSITVRRTTSLTSTSSLAQPTQPWGNYALHDGLHRLLLAQVIFTMGFWTRGGTRGPTRRIMH